jgi:hypothetical protein
MAVPKSREVSVYIEAKEKAFNLEVIKVDTLLKRL